MVGVGAALFPERRGRHEQPRERPVAIEASGGEGTRGRGVAGGRCASGNGGLVRVSVELPDCGVASRLRGTEAVDELHVGQGGRHDGKGLPDG